MRARSVIVALVSGLVGLTACSSGADTPARIPATYADYVALGDSYSAGPLMSPAVKGAPVPCSRSQANYPGYLSTYLKVKKLTDVTCSSATTEDLYSSQSIRMGLPQNSGTRTPPQLDALSSSTDLVTLGIGGNDFSVFGQTLAALAAGTPIPTGVGKQAEEVQGRVVKAIDAIAKRAPRARILVVGYLRIAPTSGTCAQFPISAEEARLADRIEQQLNASLKKAAKATDVTYIDSYGISKGHDICAGDKAWVNGGRNVLFQAAALHPFRTGMNAVAREIYRTLTSRTPGNAPSNAILGKVPRTPVS